MSYYRRPRADDNPDDIIALDNLVAMVPVEVDEWHPASEPPTPEDFEPTGWIQLWNDNKPTQISFLPVGNLPYATTHWRKITPPKMKDANQIAERAADDSKDWSLLIDGNPRAICANCGYPELIGSDDCRNCGKNFDPKTRIALEPHGATDDTKRLDWLEANHPQWAGYLTMWSGTIREAIDTAKKEGE